MERETEACMKLWAAVIEKAIMDAYFSQSVSAKRFLEDTWRFNLICELAGFDPVYAKEKITQAMNDPITMKKAKRSKRRVK